MNKTSSDLELSCPVDDQGRLLHEDDAAAQLALSVARLEAALARAGLVPGDLVTLRVLTTDRAVLVEVYDVLLERLVATGARPAIEVVETDRLPCRGMLVALDVSGTPSAYLDVGRHRSRHTPLPCHLPTNEGNRMTITPTAAHYLLGLCEGRVHLPGDPAYDMARMPWNLSADQRPAAVAVPRSVEEVVDVVRAAAAAGLRVAPQSTGHNAAPLVESGLDDVVILRLSELTGVTVDPVAGTARVIGGTLWSDVIAATSAHGFTALHGSAPDVAVAGYALGGGLSFYGRRHGLAANSITAAEIVTADGCLVRADAFQNTDLFWAVRGGGGNLGVVVAIEIGLLPFRDVHAGMLLWEGRHAPEVLSAWARWTREVPDSVTTAVRIMSFPPLPELPPFLSGRELVVIDGAVLEDDDRAGELLAPLRALAPEMDTFARIPASGLLDVHMDPPAPTPSVSDHSMLNEVTEETVSALLELVGPGTSTSLMFTELRHLGGALAAPEPGSGALSHLNGDYALFCLAPAPSPEAAIAGLADTSRVVRRLAQWSNSSRFLNFTEQKVDTSSGYDGADWARLAHIRDVIDPGRLFLANHPV